MPNIALFIRTLRSGGAEKQASILANRLSLHHRVTIFLRANRDAVDPKNQEILRQGNAIEIVSLPSGFLAEGKALYRGLRARKIEVLFNYLTYPDVIGSLVGYMAGIRKIYNGIRSSRLPLPKMIAEWWAHNLWATATIFNSHIAATYFQKRAFRKSKSVVIPNCFVFGKLDHEKTKNRNSSMEIITVGRFVPDKDYTTALLSIKELAAENLSFTYHIIGYGVLEEVIRAKIKELSLEDRVKITINPPNVMELMQGSNIYLSTSLFEGTSNSIMEAMSASLPIVATNVGDNSYLIEEGENGFLHAIGDYKAIAFSLRQLLGSCSLQEKMGEKSLMILQENYSEELFMKRYCQLID